MKFDTNIVVIEYRLGDLVLLFNNAVGRILHPDSTFQETIGYEYAKISCEANRFLDFELLRRLVKEHMEKHQYAVPPSDVLAMHYRAGDWKRVNGSEIEELASHVKNACDKSQLGKLHIVTALHFGKKLDADALEKTSKENSDNLDKLKSMVEEMGISVSVKSGGGIDEDFCYLCYADHLLPTKGGFSILAALCNSNSVHSTFPQTTNAIRHYAEKKPISLSKLELLIVSVKERMGMRPMAKYINPVAVKLEKLKPVKIPYRKAARKS